MKMGIAASLPWIAGVGGFIIGGWLSDVPFKNNRRIPLIISQWITAIFLYLTYTVQSPDMAVIYETAVGFFLMIATSIIFSLPMSAISNKITGRAMGIVNTGGQMASFISPLVVGYLVQTSSAGLKSFDTAFMYLIAATIASSVFAMAFKQRKQEAKVSG